MYTQMYVHIATIPQVNKKVIFELLNKAFLTVVWHVTMTNYALFTQSFKWMSFKNICFVEWKQILV